MAGTDWGSGDGDTRGRDYKYGDGLYFGYGEGSGRCFGVGCGYYDPERFVSRGYGYGYGGAFRCGSYKDARLF